MKQVAFCIFLLLHVLWLPAQQSLSLEEFLNVVKRYHPVAKQALVGVEIARAEVTAARGAFDPTLASDFSRKELNALLYYDHQINELKIPTWYGIDIVAGIERLNGERTSTPETKGNSSYFGFSVPVAKGLLMDGRRAALKQAKIFRDLSVQEQRTVLNDLIYDAAKAYFRWWQQYQVQLLFRQAIANAEQRFRLVKAAFEIGERPAIDTVEALAQLQSFQIQANDIGIEVTNSQLNLDVFLWRENGEAYSLPQMTVPQMSMPMAPGALQIESLLQRIQSHPELQQYQFKLRALQVEKQLKFQSLLPSVYLKYNQLNNSHEVQKLFNTPWLENNYRYGASIAIPLRLSEGRGEYRKAKLKIEQVELQQVNKQITLEAKLRQYFNEWQQIGRQAVLQQQAIQSFAALQKGEELKFTNGESSLFLVNARELKTLEARQKLVELQSKEQQSAFSALWAAGELANY